MGYEVEFCFFRPGVSQVDLVGDFNQWRDGSTPMSPGRDGYWRVKLQLPQGKYRFRYRADGQWFTDYAAFGIEHGPYGPDSVVVVPTAY